MMEPKGLSWYPQKLCWLWALPYIGFGVFPVGTMWLECEADHTSKPILSLEYAHLHGQTLYTDYGMLFTGHLILTCSQSLKPCHIKLIV